LRTRFDDASTNLGGDLIQWQYLIGEAGSGDKARHPPDHATMFVLREDLSVNIADLFAAAQAILAHSRQNDS
jgi:hypothetical protein